MKLRTRPKRIVHFLGSIGLGLDDMTLVSKTKSARYGCISLFEHPDLGKVFVLNGEIQHVEAWAPLYHEPLIHLAGSFVNKLRRVLVLGGGTLFAAFEALKYESVCEVLVIDQNQQVIEMVREHYEHAQACFKDGRLKLIHADAYSSLANQKTKFDLIVNDAANLLPDGEVPRHTTRYVMMGKALSAAGVCSDVVSRHIFEKRATCRTLKYLRVFPRSACSLIFLPEYHGVLHLLYIWGYSSFITQCAERPRNEEQLQWLRRGNPPCVYYNPKFLKHHLYLPPYLRDATGLKRTSF